MEQETNEVRRLPLWRGALELIDNGITYGDRIEKSWFEQRLSCSAETMEFSLAVSEIRKELEHRGLYLSGRSTSGEAFRVLDAEENASMVASYQIDAIHALRRASTLGTNTDTSALSDAQKKAHESTLEKAERRLALILGVRRRPSLAG